MNATEWADRFEAAVRQWQERLGLYDWNFSYDRKPGDGLKAAEVNMDHDAREAVFTAYLWEQRDDPERIAFHEVLHVGMNDMEEMLVRRGDHEHPDVAREAHRFIERIVNLQYGRP
jgi:hypothetical protein